MRRKTLHDAASSAGETSKRIATKDGESPEDKSSARKGVTRPVTIRQSMGGEERQAMILFDDHEVTAWGAKHEVG